MLRDHVTRASVTAAIIMTIEAHTMPERESCGFAVLPQREPRDSSPSASISISGDGRWLAFSSYAPLRPEGANDRSDVYVFDMVERRLTLESARSDGRPSNGDSFRPTISDDGRFVVFESNGQLTSGTDPMVQQVVLRDRQLGITSVLSASRAGDLGNHRSGHPVISADGGVVAFDSYATNLVSGTNARGSTRAVYAVTLATRSIVRVSPDSGERQEYDGASYGPSISADGMRIAFTSTAPLAAENDVRDPIPGTQKAPWPHVFVRDLAAGTTHRVSRIISGETDGPSYLPAISSDGRWVTFVSDATNLVRGDKNGASDVLLHDLHTSTTSLVSRSASGGTASGASTRPAISADGRFVVFESDASNLVCSRRCPPRDQDTNLVSDIFLFDRTRDTMVRISADAESGWIEPSRSPAIAAHAAVVAFSSRRPMNERDRGDDFDLFVRAGCMPTSAPGN